MVAARLLVLALMGPVALSAAGPRRIVSTSPGITEILYALGLGDRVVGVTNYCHYPPEAAKKTKIGSYLQPNLEVVIGLRPDLVVTESSIARRSPQVAALRNTLEVTNGTLPGIYDTIAKIGAAAGVQRAAAELGGRIRASLEQVRQRTAKFPTVRVVFVVGRAPDGLSDLIVAGKGSYLDDVMAVAGGVNIFRDTAAPYAKVTLEEMLARNPQVIVDMGEMAQTVGVTEQAKRAVVALWSRYPALEAVKRRRVFAVASDIFVVPGPRVVDAAREFAKMFHPEAGF